MSEQTHIVAAMYREKPALNFDDIVAEFEMSLRIRISGRRSVTFDHDDLVIIDIEGMRIGLAWVEPDLPGQPYSLILATGATQDQSSGTATATACSDLNETVLSRLQTATAYETVIRATLPEALDGELLDQVATGLHTIVAEDDPTTPAPHILDDIATPRKTSDAAHNVPDEPAQDTAARRKPERSVTRLRAVYLDEDENPGGVWQTVIAGTNTMLETLTHGADLVRQVSGSSANPYDRLKPRRRTRLASDQGERFDPAEYELYGNLLD